MPPSGASWALPPLPANHGSPKPRWTDSTAPRTRPSVGLLRKPSPLQLRPCVWRAACKATGPSLRDSQPTPGREPPGAPEGHPARIALEKDQPHGLCRDSWRELSNRISSTLPNELADREPLPTIEEEVWTPQKRWRVNNTVGGLGRSEETKQKATETIRNIDATWTIYTDGSAKDGTRDGGSAMVVTTGDPLDPQTIFSETIRGRMLTSSFDEEKEALGAAVRWLEDNTPNNSDKGLICTDSQALTSALANDSREVSNITRKLDTLNREIILQWIPSHVGIVGNERAEALANEASGLKERAKPTTYKSAVATIKRTIKDLSPSHARTAQVYQKLSRERDEKTLLSRRDAVMLARLRSGHSMLLAGYRTLMNPAESPSCPRCEEANETVEHWLLDCPGTLAARQEIFGGTTVELSILTEDPEGAVALAKRTLGKNSAHPQ